MVERAYTAYWPRTGVAKAAEFSHWLMLLCSAYGEGRICRGSSSVKPGVIPRPVRPVVTLNCAPREHANNSGNAPALLPPKSSFVNWYPVVICALSSRISVTLCLFGEPGQGRNCKNLCAGVCRQVSSTIKVVLSGGELVLKCRRNV